MVVGMVVLPSGSVSSLLGASRLTMITTSENATQRTLAHRPQAYSPKCVELEFSEVHIQDPAYHHPGTPKNTYPGNLHSPVPIPLVTPMDRYARSWMFFLQPNVWTSERTPYAPSLMLQVAGRGYAELLRKPNMRTSENSVFAQLGTQAEKYYPQAPTSS